MEDTLSKFMSESAKRHEENSNLIKEIRASTDAAIRNQGASIKTLEIQIEQMSKVLQERGFGSLPSSTKTNPRDHDKSISTIVEVDSYLIRRIGSPQYAVSTGQNHPQLLPPEWSKFMTNVKLVKELHTSNFDQLHAYLEQHELHANEVRIMRERNQDPLAFIANQQMTPPHFNTYQSSYNNPQLQQ
ncbi:hypothetical protein Tco_0812682 [Tanacetum coccineum]